MNHKAKKEKLKSIRSEVKEFHPLLLTLFNRLSDIINVEYTHGTSEKGADFILTKYDKTLDNVDYVGVIAKTGKIQHTKKQVLPRVIIQNFKYYNILVDRSTTT